MLSCNKETGRDVWFRAGCYERANVFFSRILRFFEKLLLRRGDVCTRTRANRRTRLRRDCRDVYVYACAGKRASEWAADVHVQRRGKHKLPMLLYARTHTHKRQSLSGAKDAVFVVVGRVLASTGYDVRSRRRRIYLGTAPPPPPRTRFLFRRSQT